jgi:hypothetical protein
MEVVIADDAEHEDLFADIGDEKMYWGRVIYDRATKRFMLTIFHLPDQDQYVFPLAKVQTALEEARKRLTELGYEEIE